MDPYCEQADDDKYTIGIAAALCLASLPVIYFGTRFLVSDLAMETVADCPALHLGSPNHGVHPSIPVPTASEMVRPKHLSLRFIHHHFVMDWCFWLIRHHRFYFWYLFSEVFGPDLNFSVSFDLILAGVNCVKPPSSDGIGFVHWPASISAPLPVSFP